MRVIIVGIGGVGEQLAEDLSARSNFELVLIDQNEEKAQTLSQRLDAFVLHGDGTDPQVLERARPEDADALIASTESDGLNMVIGLLARKLSIPQVIVKLNSSALKTTCYELGIDQVISPKISAANQIVGLLSGYDVLDFSLLVRGGGQLAEVGPGRMAGARMRELNLPEGALVISIIREGTAIIPRGETEIYEEDILVLLAEDEVKMRRAVTALGERRAATRTDELKEVLQ